MWLRQRSDVLALPWKIVFQSFSNILHPEGMLNLAQGANRCNEGGFLGLHKHQDKRSTEEMGDMHSWWGF